MLKDRRKSTGHLAPLTSIGERQSSRAQGNLRPFPPASPSVARPDMRTKSPQASSTTGVEVKKPRTLPVVPNPDEVARFYAAVIIDKHSDLTGLGKQTSDRVAPPAGLTPRTARTV